MKMFKFLFSAMLIMASMDYVVSQRRQMLRSRVSSTCTMHSEVTALINKGHCRPVDQPVPVPVPDGYESVIPSVVLLPRCDGMGCSSSLACIPLQEHMRNISIPVYGYTVDRRRVCTTVPVVVHEGCKCDCPTSCPPHQMLRSGMYCGCECDGEEQAICESRQRLWDPTTCSCQCPIYQKPRCSSGQVFVKELCRCENY